MYECEMMYAKAQVRLHAAATAVVLPLHNSRRAPLTTIPPPASSPRPSSPPRHERQSSEVNRPGTPLEADVRREREERPSLTRADAQTLTGHENFPRLHQHLSVDTPRFNRGLLVIPQGILGGQRAVWLTCRYWGLWHLTTSRPAAKWSLA